MSGLFGATTIPGNRITDFADQTATVGTPIPFGYGTFPVTKCNVIWIDDVVEHVTKKKQGKGGVKTEEYTYTRSYAIGVCQGQVYGFLIVRRNGKVVYTEDPNAPAEDVAYAAKWKESATFYFGTREQLPDSTIEAAEGAGQVSAFRDLAYFVVENDDVTDGAGAVPSYEVVVVASPPEVYMTSRPYAIEADDALVTDYAPQRVHFQPQPTINQDALNVTLAPVQIARYGGQKTYATPNEDVLAVSVSPVEITRYGGQAVYDAPNEDILTVSLSPVSITRFGSQVEYDVPSEGITVSLQPVSITRETV